MATSADEHDVVDRLRIGRTPLSMPMALARCPSAQGREYGESLHLALSFEQTCPTPIRHTGIIAPSILDIGDTASGSKIHHCGVS